MKKAVANEVRIIGGQWKRSKLPVADKPGLRPTPDRVRETLFNWLGQNLGDWRVLDAFAGSGALGFEAASRGAATVLLLERDADLVSDYSLLKDVMTWPSFYDDLNGPGFINDENNCPHYIRLHNRISVP